MLRTCKKCKLSKPIDDYHKFDSAREGRRYECKPCLKSRTRVWRLTKTYRAVKKAFCESCGFKAVNSCQLDVDHIDGNHLNNEAVNLQTLCANCHRLKTLINKDGRYS